jgi:DNA polymerase I-like protein with 3'-5' exonuclease and polymerase domains
MAMDRDFQTYGALDAACTLEIKNGFFHEMGKFKPAYDMTLHIFPVLIFMQTRGVKVNKVNLDKAKAHILSEKAERQKELDSIVGKPLNVDSPKQCQDYFYNTLGIKPYLNKTGKPTVDDLALQRLVRGVSGRPGLRQAKLVQEIRGLGKLYGTYLNMEFDTDGRMRGSYNPRGTKFGRLSSSKTIFGTGMNFQNLPDEFKQFLVADDGYCLVEVDKRQAEWVVVAYATGDAAMIAAIEAGIDVHTATAMEMFKVTPEVVKRDHKLCAHVTNADEIRRLRMEDEVLCKLMNPGWPRAMSLRQCGKKSNHGLNYDEGYRGFAMINEIEESEAKKIVDMYHRIYPGIRIWYESVKAELKRNNRVLTNCFGRAVRFMGAWGDDLWKSAYSMIPQSTVVDSLNQGMEKIYEDNRLCGSSGFNGDVLAQVHDSVLMQFPIDVLEVRDNFEFIRDTITDYTSPTMSYNGRDFKIASDYKFGMNWGGYNPDKNPLGMQEFEDFESFTKALAEWREHGAGTQRVVG